MSRSNGKLDFYQRRAALEKEIHKLRLKNEEFCSQNTITRIIGVVL